jgi:hypothetical protein
MGWPMPSREQLRNILYYSTSGFRGTGSPLGHLIHNARVAQAMVVFNRARQEVATSPGWGWGHGTERATDHPSPDAGILQECWVAAGEAMSIFGLIREDDLHQPLNMHGAQMFRHSRELPGTQWPDNPDTRLIASYGSMLSPEQIAACEAHQRRREPHRNVCNGYLSVYVSMGLLGRALAARELGCRPHEVPMGPVRRRWNEYARNSIDWGSLMQRYSS